MMFLRKFLIYLLYLLIFTLFIGGCRTVYAKDYKLNPEGMRQFKKDIGKKPENYFNDEIRSSQARHIKELLAIIHPSDIWDSSEGARKGVESLLQIRTTQINHSLVVLSKDSQDLITNSPFHYYADSEDVDFTVYSESGSHGHEFNNLEILILAGGNMGFCLCEFVMNTIQNDTRQSTLEFIFVTDAIYINLDRSERSTTRWNHFRTKAELEPISGYTASLAKFAKGLESDQFLEAIYRHFVSPENGNFCYLQSLGKVNINDFRLKMSTSDSDPKIYGSGPIALNFKFLTVNELVNVLGKK